MAKKPRPSRPKKSKEEKAKKSQEEQPKKSPEELLLEFIQTEHSFYQEILKISTLENEKLASPESILEIQFLEKKKQEMMAHIHNLEETVSPLKQQWLQKRDRTAPVDKLIQSEMAAMNRVLAGILQMDLKNHKLMEVYLLILKDKTKEAGPDAPKVETE